MIGVVNNMRKIGAILSIILICVMITGLLVSCKGSPSIEELVADLDKNFSDLDDFEMEAPFDLNRIDDYRLSTISDQNHMGIDFFSQNSVPSIPFLALYDGIVTNTEFFVMENQGGQDNWAVRIFVTINSKYMYLLGFETFGDTEEIRALQEENIFVKAGDYVKTGDLIGNLIIGSQFAHVHYSLKYLNVPDEESWVVPEPFFSDTAVGLMNQVFGYEAIQN